MKPPPEQPRGKGCEDEQVEAHEQRGAHEDHEREQEQGEHPAPHPGAVMGVCWVAHNVQRQSQGPHGTE